MGTWLQSLTFMHDRKCTPKHVLPLHEKMSLTRAHADARDRLEQRDNLKSWRSEWGEGGGVPRIRPRFQATLSAQRRVSTSALEN